MVWQDEFSEFPGCPDEDGGQEQVSGGKVKLERWNRAPFHCGNQDEGRLALVVKNLPASAGDIRPRGQDPLEEGTATHSTVLAWRVSWTQEPGGLQSIGSQRAGHN